MNDIAATVAAHIRQYSDTFGSAFHSSDPTLLRPYCHIPCVAIGRGRLLTMETEDASDKRWRRALDGLPKNYDHSVLHSVDVLMTDDRTAFVTVDCGRFDNQGIEYARFWASYITIETDEGWRITTWIGHGQPPEHQIL